MQFIKNIKQKIKLSSLGFLADSKGIERRYNREKKNWDIHLNNTKEFILNSTKSESGTLLVLGSGRLLDLPLDALSRSFSKIYLYDIIHTAKVKKEVSKFNNVELITADITGGMLNEAYKLKRKNGQFFSYTNHFSNINFETNFNPDFVISLNILNQLDIILIDYLKQKTDISAHEIKKLRIDIQQKHLHFIQQYNHCLIADIEEEWYDDNDKLIGIKPTVFVDFNNYKEQKKWLWKFDTSTTYYSDRKTYFNVIAVTNSSL